MRPVWSLPIARAIPATLLPVVGSDSFVAMIAPPDGLRVLHVDSGQEWQSVRDQVRLLVEGLRNEPGIHQAVATLDSSRLAVECEALGVRVIPLPHASGGNPRAPQELARHVRGEWDVFHAHDGPALTMLLYILALDGSDTPLVAARRYSAVPRFPSRWRRVNLILAATASARNGLIAAGVEPGRIAVVPNGIDADALVETEPGALRRAIGAKPGHRLIGSFTALTRHRDHTTLLRAAVRLGHDCPEARFAMLGRGPERPKLEDQIERLGLEGQVCLPGYLPDARRYMGDIDVFVMPSFDEELTSACLEAMVAGRPVVMPTRGPRNDASGAGPVRVPARDPDALAQEILRLLEDPEYYDASVARGRRFTKRHGPEALVARTLAAYRQVVRPPRRGWRGGAHRGRLTAETP
jgi:glycosyltransferase involved in cell wall biosynthesis